MRDDFTLIADYYHIFTISLFDTLMLLRCFSDAVVAYMLLSRHFMLLCRACFYIIFTPLRYYYFTSPISLPCYAPLMPLIFRRRIFAATMPHAALMMLLILLITPLSRHAAAMRRFYYAAFPLRRH